MVFGVLATTFCPSAIRNALSASGAVRVRDVMFNRNQKNDRFTDRFSDSIMLILYNVGVKND